MKEKRCEAVCREIEESTLGQEFSAVASEHLRTCAECQEFRRQQSTLRQIVGSLGTVNAPADFDFRLRARLAADSQRSSFRFSSFAVKGLATAAILVVFGVGGAVIWQREHQPVTVAEGPRIEQKTPAQPKVTTLPAPEVTPMVVKNNEPKHNPTLRAERPFVAKANRSTLSSKEFSSEGAPVISNGRPALNNSTVFPIEASLQSVKVSLDDGRGNARTISFPPVSFGSQRVLTTANQYPPKGIW